MISALRHGPMTLLDLAQRFKAPVKTIIEDLEHIRRSLRGGDRLRQIEPECLSCGFSFRGRKHFNKPSRCPECRGEQISAPEFCISGPISGDPISTGT